MNYEVHLLAKVMRSDKPMEAMSKVLEEDNGRWIFEVYKLEFSVLKEHYFLYSSIPTEDTFLQKFPGTMIPKTPEPLEFYLDEVMASHIYARMADMNNHAVELMKDNRAMDAFKYVRKEMQGLESVVSRSSDVNMAMDVPARIDRYDKRRHKGPVTGVPTGWTRLDQETTGFQSTELTFIVGRMGSFKTWVLICWATWAWLQGHNVLIFSREMGYEQFARRVDTFLAKTRFKDIKTGIIENAVFDKFKQSLVDIYKNAKSEMILVDSAGAGDYSVAFIRTKIREYKPDAVFIDGAYLLDAPGKAEWEKQTHVTRTLKKTALYEKIPIIATTQASKGGAKRIQLTNIAYSDSYGQDADNVIALNRIWDKLKQEFTKEILVEILKARDAETIKIKVKVDLDAMQITEGYDQIQEEGDAVFGEQTDKEDLMI